MKKTNKDRVIPVFSTNSSRWIVIPGSKPPLAIRVAPAHNAGPAVAYVRPCALPLPSDDHCYACNGLGKVDNSTPDRDSRITCAVCNGTGESPAARLQAKEDARVREKLTGQALTKGGLSVDAAHRRERILSITTQLVTGQIEQGKLDPSDDQALRKATRQAVEDAKAAYDAAVEYLSG